MVKDHEIIKEALERFELAHGAEAENRRCALEDIRFVSEDGAQWDEQQKKQRKGRPCLQFDQLSGHIDQVNGDHLQNKPGIKVRGQSGGADPDVAEVYTGLIRNIESQSSAKRAYDVAFKMATMGGFGAWRVINDYADDDSFEQDISIKAIPNPFTVLFDPNSIELDRSDGAYAFVFENMPRDIFIDMYPKAQTADFDSSTVGQQYEGWWDEETIRVCEYFRKVPVTKNLLMLNDGMTVYSDEFEPVADELFQQGIYPVKEREVQCDQVEWYKLTSKDVLEKQTDFPSKYIPVVPCFGHTINIEGKIHYWGMVRKARDAQRYYNYNKSAIAESAGLAPKAPLMATPDMIEGHERQYKTLNTENPPVLLYNADPKSPTGMPQRTQQPEVNAALINEAMAAKDDIKAATGIFDASLGMRSNETSGKAILARQREGDTANYTYTDHMAAALEYTGKILVDMIPQIYDTERQVRVLGEDGSDSEAVINQTVLDEQTGEPVILNDLTQGKYDVTVTVGPSYATKRIETAEQLIQLAQALPAIGEITADVLVKSLDLNEGEEITQRLRRLGIQNGTIEPTEEEAAEMAPQEPSEDEIKAKALAEKNAEVEIMGKAAKARKDNADAEAQELETDMVEAGLRDLVNG